MAAKKKKSAQKTYGNKTKFVLGLSRDLSAEQVVDEAKKAGIAITEAHVYKIRSTAKAKGPKAGKSAGRASAAKGGASSSQSKRDFVLSFGPDTKASEILQKAKAVGIGLSKAYLYTIRSAGGASNKRGRKGATGGSSATASAKAAALRGARGAAASVEAQFIDAAIDLGLAKAGDLLQRLRARLKDF